MIVIANGMLRSGSTLQYNLAARVLETAGPLTRAGFLGDFSNPETRTRLEEMKASDGWTIIKTHEAPLPRDFYDGRVRVLFSYRDVRDIAASIRKKWGFPFEQIISDIASMIEIERAVAELPNVLVQSYDKLYYDPPSATHEISQFLNIPLDEAAVARISVETSIDSQSNAIARSSTLVRGLVNRLKRQAYDAKTLLHPDHISATGGKDGDWKNQFTEAQINMLSDRFGDWLIAHSYQNSTVNES
jgi:hypothetical protein